jgi:hypothetical protein
MTCLGRQKLYCTAADFCESRNEKTAFLGAVFHTPSILLLWKGCQWVVTH